MSPNATLITNLVNLYVRNDGVKAFHNLNLNTILLLLTELADSGGGGSTGTLCVEVTSADFSGPTTCPLPALNGVNYALFYDEGGRHLHQAAGEWSYLTGGGFTVNLPGFDSTASTVHFVLYIK